MPPTVVYPDGTPTLGMTKLTLLTSIGDIAGASPIDVELADEINAVTSVEVSGYLYPAGWAPGATQNKGTAPARLASKAQAERLNRVTRTMGDLQYVYGPQAASNAAVNKALALCVEGTILYAVERIGLDAETVDFTAGQQLWVHPIKLGVQIPSGDRTDENGEFFITQPAVYTTVNGPIKGVVIA